MKVKELIDYLKNFDEENDILLNQCIGYRVLKPENLRYQNNIIWIDI